MNRKSRAEFRELFGNRHNAAMYHAMGIPYGEKKPKVKLNFKIEFKGLFETINTN